MKLAQTNHICTVKLDRLIILISSIVQLLFSRVHQFCCFRPGPHVFYKYARHYHLGRPRNVALLPHDVLNLCYYKDWTDNQKYFYICKENSLKERKHILRKKDKVPVEFDVHDYIDISEISLARLLSNYRTKNKHAIYFAQKVSSILQTENGEYLIAFNKHVIIDASTKAITNLRARTFQ